MYRQYTELSSALPLVFFLERGLRAVGKFLCVLYGKSKYLAIFRSLSKMGGLPIQNSSSALALQGSQPNQGSGVTSSATETKPKKKICCACPETKKLRDECIVEHGEEACAKWIEAHRKCLRAEGFNV